eukprot:773188-Pelagomonas_calceolata.AAC.2
MSSRGWPDNGQGQRAPHTAFWMRPSMLLCHISRHSRHPDRHVSLKPVSALPQLTCNQSQGSWPVLPRRQPITKWVHSADAAIGADLAVLACPVQVWHARCRVIVHNQRRTTWVRHAQPVTQVRHAQWLRGAQWSRRAQPVMHNMG